MPPKEATTTKSASSEETKLTPPLHSMSWGYLDAQFVTRGILKVDDEYAILLIDVDDQSPTTRQRIAFRVKYDNIDDEEIEINLSGTVTIALNANRSGSLESITAELVKLPTGDTWWEITDCKNYAS